MAPSDGARDASAKQSVLAPPLFPDDARYALSIAFPMSYFSRKDRMEKLVGVGSTERRVLKKNIADQ